MAWSALFGAGTLSYGATSIPVQNITMTKKASIIKLQANKEFPIAAATGPKEISGTFEVAGYESTLFAAIENGTMAPISSATTLTWVLPAQGGTSVTFTLQNVVLGETSVSGKNDGFMTMKVNYEAIPELNGDTVLAIS